jgi:hypothetical protein
VHRAIPRDSNHRLLATSFESGDSIDGPEVAALSEERRVRLFLLEIFDYKIRQNDPHLGNYKIRLGEEQDQIVLLEWGAVREFKDCFLEHYKDLILGAIGRPADRVIRSGIGISFLREEDSPRLKQCFVEIADIAIEPWLDPHDPWVPSHWVDGNGCYMWSRSDLPTRIATLAWQ